MAPPAVIELRVPSELRFLSLVDAVTQGILRDLEWDADAAGNLSTAVIEAAANGIEHGNRLAAEKSVAVRFLLSADGTLEVEIDDQGSGFDPRPYERELTTDDLLKPRGRGIYIMRSFMDRLEFQPLAAGGMRVRLRKRAGATKTDGGAG
jgi:serine/threonine-protein kinase RsbW